MRVRVSRLVLVGLSGSGKTTVGSLLAGRLGWELLDVDAAVAAAEGLDIAAIFRAHGVAGFRRREAAAVGAALVRSRVVVVPGAGWAAQPGALDGLPSDAVVVWLRVDPAVAAERLRGTTEERPLLAQGDMATRLAEMHAERQSSYARAGIVVDTDGRTPEEVAEQIAAHLASRYGIDGRAD